MFQEISRLYVTMLAFSEKFITMLISISSSLRLFSYAIYSQQRFLKSKVNISQLQQYLTVGDTHPFFS